LGIKERRGKDKGERKGEGRGGRKRREEKSSLMRGVGGRRR